ncbi:hypothetical protein BRADI_4g20745v3 [Brachypodium distachyon]|uniref:Uncharacterized protein n=1 Tax=Brachypodium distachyon TaxID=15368 RepID=A0A2K2CP17_BRADI|nr:hypothetical protein BRADI_4g20745v3 [Brachypodium distachyon]
MGCAEHFAKLVHSSEATPKSLTMAEQREDHARWAAGSEQKRGKMMLHREYLVHPDLVMILVIGSMVMSSLLIRQIQKVCRLPGETVLGVMDIWLHLSKWFVGSHWSAHFLHFCGVQIRLWLTWRTWSLVSFDSG